MADQSWKKASSTQDFRHGDRVLVGISNTSSFSAEISCIAEAVQEKLLSDYEAEIKNESKKPSHSKKDSNASDDWEKLSDDASSK